MTSYLVRLQEGLRLQSAALRVAIRCSALPITCPLYRHERHRMWRLYESLFGGDRLGVYPEVPLDRLAPLSLRVTLSHLPTESYTVTDYELLALVVLAARLRPKCMFEFGTANGRTTLNLALNSPEDAKLYTLSLPLEQDPGHAQGVPVGHAFHDTEVQNRVIQLWGDSRTFDFTPYAEQCQMIFIDADHSQMGVTADTRSALGMIDRENGVIVWHDALRFGVQSALPRLVCSVGPIHLMARTNLAILCFRGGNAVTPDLWEPEND